MMIDFGIVSDLLNYDEMTGIFIWKPRPLSMFISEKSYKTWNTRYAWRKAGSLRPECGYVTIGIQGTKHYAHRLAWLMMTGAYPCAPNTVDHRNGVSSDNRWCNLREATSLQQQYNKKSRRATASGVKGVWYHGRGRKLWGARIKISGKNKSLGYYKTIDEAAVAYSRASKELHGEFYRT